ncbi:MAG: hypothetical protein ABW000_07160 [Actinoplanes sp.]
MTPRPPFVIELPFAKQTAGAVMYAVPADQRNAVPVSNVYIRQDYLARDGNGSWPASVTVTVEVHQ